MSEEGSIKIVKSKAMANWSRQSLSVVPLGAHRTDWLATLPRFVFKYCFIAMGPKRPNTGAKLLRLCSRATHVGL